MVNRSTLLLGGRGLNLRQRAEEMAMEVLDTKDLSSHPDFIAIESDGKVISLDTILPIFQLVQLVPVGENYAVIIDGIDKLSAQAANKLLKLIEENQQLILLGISHGGNVLPTIRSRMASVVFAPRSREDFASSYGDDGELLYALCRGRDGLVEEVTPYLDIYRRVYYCVVSGESEKLLTTLNLVKENDKNAFSTACPEQIPNLLSLIEYVYAEKARRTMDERYMRAVETIAENKNECKKTSYGKNEFFALIIELVMIDQGKEAKNGII